VKNNVIT